MRLILVGPPGAGKGTQANHLVRAHHLAHISTGEMLRSAIARRTELGIAAESYMKRGDLVADEMVINMLFERIKNPDCEKGFLLDGFPRTRAQAVVLNDMLKSKNIAIDAVIVLDVPDSMIVERITGRRHDPKTGITYHLTFNPPPTSVRDRLEQRDDDTKEACEARLHKYHSETELVIPFYEEQKLVHRINAVGTPDEIEKRIINAVFK